jgi:methionine-rich copper-binding protein CopC
MRRFLVALAALILPMFVAGPALAHTSVVATSIAENARLTAAPETFTVEFSAPVGLVSVALNNAEGTSLPLSFRPTQQLAARHTIALPNVPVGSYTLSWRTIARDGHAMQGSLHFVVSGR